MATVNLVQCVFDRTALAVGEDVAVVTMHCRGVTSGLPDDLFPMDNTARADFKSKLDFFWGGVSNLISNKLSLVAYKSYDMPSTPGLLGPPVQTLTPGAMTFSSSAPAPAQVAMSVTWITDARKTWGRFYIPGPLAGNWDNAGRITIANCSTIANAAKGLAKRSSSGATLTVWSRTHWTHHDPQYVQVDDVPDVIRSRRLSSPITRAKVAVGT
jgi:hypothetical protein